MSSTDLLNALAAQLGREKVVAMCEAFLSTKSAAEAKVKKVLKPSAVAAPAVAASAGEDAKPKRVLPFKLIQWQAFVRYCKDRFPDRFEGVKGAPAMQQLCKTLKEEEGVWEAFEASDVCPQPALEPAHAGTAPAAEDSEDEVKEVKPKRKWSEEAKAAAKAKRAAKKAAGGSSGSDSESVHSASSGKKVKDE